MRTDGGSKPLQFSFIRGKPGGVGGGQYISPSALRHIARCLLLARHWAGLFGDVPALFTQAEKLAVCGVLDLGDKLPPDKKLCYGV